MKGQFIHDPHGISGCGFPKTTAILAGFSGENKKSRAATLQEKWSNSPGLH